MQNPKYPRSWRKVSLIIRRLANGRCTWCNAKCLTLFVHHLGVHYANRRPGDSQDKHDIRRENLVALCWDCHHVADAQTYERCRARKARREQHRSLGIGTGLIAVGKS